MEAAAAAAAESASASESAAASPGHRRRFMLNLPPGFHFCPREDELIVYYLRRKMAGLPLPLPIFVDERIIDYSPQQIVEKYREYGENRWYFFTRRERRYAKGNRPYRTTPDNGYWKATGNYRDIFSGETAVGRVRTLVFYFWLDKKKVEGAPAPEEVDEKTASKKVLKTSWTMYEYENLTSQAEAKNKDIDKMDELVLCTIQKKQRRDDVEEGKKKEGEGQKGSPAGGNGEVGSSAGGKKRKRKKNIKAPKGTVGRQADHPTKRYTVPMPPKELSQSPPEGGNCTIPPNMHMVQYSGCPIQRSPPPQEPPHPEMVVPPVGDGYNFDPNTAMHQLSNHPISKPPVPSPPPGLPQSMMVPPSGGDNCKNLAPITGISQQHTHEETAAASSSDMTWTSHGSNSYGIYASMLMGISYGHHPFLERSSYEQQPYLQQHVPQHSTVAPPGVYNQSGVARNTTGCSNNYGYAHSAFDNIVRFPSLPSAASTSSSTSTQSMFMVNGVASNNHRGFPASQQHGGRVITGGVYAPAL